MRVWTAITYEDIGGPESGPKVRPVLLEDLVGYHFETEHRKYRNRWKRERRKLKKLKLPCKPFVERIAFEELHGEELEEHLKYVKENEDAYRYYQHQRFAGGPCALLHELFGY